LNNRPADTDHGYVIITSVKRAILCLVFVVAFSLLAGSDAFAQYTSSNYKAEETFFGSGGELDASSSNYKAQSSVGALGVGYGNSSTYQAYSGFLTPNEPFLEMTVNTSSVNLGVLDSTATKTGNATFTVRAYTDSGYTVQTVSQPPQTNTGITLAAKTSQGASTVGTEEFGINMVANTSPASFGADPSLQPDSTFASGIAAPGYRTANQYKYNAGDTIACTGSAGTCGSVSGWGATTYTISYIANISSITRAGAYSMVHDLVVVATY
jgi:hypothetical protein